MADWMRDQLDAGAKRLITERDAVHDEIRRQGTLWAAGEIQTLRRQLEAARQALHKLTLGVSDA